MRNNIILIFSCLIVFVQPPTKANNVDCTIEENPGAAVACFVRKELVERVYFEANVKKSLFDGSDSDNACKQILYNSGTMYQNEKDPAALACVLMMCGEDDVYNADYGANDSVCDWFKLLAGTERERIGIRQTMQDLKNYLALMDIEKAKAKSRLVTIKFPDFEDIVFSGVKENVFRQLVLDRMTLYDAEYVDDLYFQSKRSSNTETYVRRRLYNFCSVLEGGESEYFDNLDIQTTKHCVPRESYYPNDLHASSLYRNKTLDPLDQSQAKQFIKNIISPVPIPLKTVDNIYVDPDVAMKKESSVNKVVNTFVFAKRGKSHLDAKFQELMINSVAMEIFRKTHSERMPIEREEDYNPPEGIGEQLARSSLSENIAREATRRTYDANWHEVLGRAGKTALLREAAEVMATELFVTFMMLEKLQNTELLTIIDLIQFAKINNVSPPNLGELQGKLEGEI